MQEKLVDANLKQQEELANAQQRLHTQNSLIDAERLNQERIQQSLLDLQTQQLQSDQLKQTLLLKSPELIAQLNSQQSTLNHLNTEVEKITSENDSLNTEIQTLTTKKEQTNLDLISQQEKLQVQKTLFTSTVEEEERLHNELKEASRLEAVEKQRIEDLRIRRYDNAVILQCFARIFLAKRRRKHRIFQRALTAHERKIAAILIQAHIRRYLALQLVAYLMHQKYLKMVNDKALVLQCFVRIYFSIKKTTFIRIDNANRNKRECETKEEKERLEADKKQREKERLRIEKFINRQQLLQQLEDGKKERGLHMIARETVLKRKKIIENRAKSKMVPSLSAISEVIHCLKRFGGDLALQTDGFECILRACQTCPPLCNYLLDKNIANVLHCSLKTASASASAPAPALTVIAKDLMRILTAADDLKRALPVAYEADMKKLKHQQKSIPTPENEFWVLAQQRSEISGGENFDREKSWEEVSGMKLERSGVKGGAMTSMHAANCFFFFIWRSAKWNRWWRTKRRTTSI